MLIGVPPAANDVAEEAGVAVSLLRMPQPRSLIGGERGVLLSTSTKPRVLLSSTNRVCQELIFNMNQGQQKAVTSTTDSKGEVCKIP
ncbi:hypothetical protein Q9966_003187 [Columba livia]|nr:hypothetical protein Q9966_003187 [Columba livia]